MSLQAKKVPVLDPHAASLRPGRVLDMQEIRRLKPGDLVFRSAQGGPFFLQVATEWVDDCLVARDYYHPVKGWQRGGGATHLTGRCVIRTAEGKEP